MAERKTKDIDSGAKAALELNEHVQVILKELVRVGQYDRVPVLRTVLALFGLDHSDLG